MPEDKLPISQFAAKIKAKYPQYKDINDTLLVQKIVAKYPEYQNQVDLSGISEPDKKKENSAFQDIGKIFGTSVSPSKSQLQSPNVITLSPEEQARINKGKVSSGEDIGFNPYDPAKTILTTFYQKQNEAVQKSRMNVAESVGQQFLSPINQQQADVQSQQTHDVNTSMENLFEAKNIVSKRLFPSGKDAKDYLTKKIVNTGGLAQDNETDNIAIERKNEYDNLYKNITDAQSITGASLIEKLNQDQNLRKQSESLYKEGLNLPPEVQGQALVEYLYKYRNDLEDLAKEHPEIKEDYEDLKENLFTKFPEIGKSVVANNISQAREKLGYNNMFGNFRTNKFEKHNDEVAKNLPADQKKIWEENKEEITKMIDTGGFLNRFEEAIEGGWSSTKGLFNRVSGLNTKGERINDEMVKEAMTVNNGETGWKKTLGTAGNFAGVIAYMMAGGRLTQGFGMTPTAADATLNVATFGEDMFRNGEMKYPDNPFKATLNGLANTIAFASLSPLKSGKLNEVMDRVMPNMDRVIKELPENATAATAKKTISDALAESLKQYGISVGEIGVVLPAFSQGIDLAMGLDTQTFEKYHHGEFERSIKDMAIGALLPSAARFGLEARAIRKQGTQETISPEQQTIRSAIDNNQFENDIFKNMAIDAIQTPEKSTQFLKEVAQQANGTKKESETAVKVFGEDLVNKAKELFPQEKVEVSEELKNLTEEAPIEEKVTPSERVTPKEEPISTPTEQGFEREAGQKGSWRMNIEENENFPKPSKPIHDMNSSELNKYAKDVEVYNNGLEERIFGKENAKKYKEAQSIVNSQIGHANKEKYDEANKIIENLESRLSEKDLNELHGFGLPENLITESSEINDLSNRVKIIEDAENVKELSKSLKTPLLKFDPNKNNIEPLTLINAAKKRAEQLNIDPIELIKESFKNISKDLSNKYDATYLLNDILNKISKPTEQKTEGGKALGVSEKENVVSGGEEKPLPKSRRENVIKQAKEIEITDANPYHVALQYFAKGGKIHPSAIQELYGDKETRLHMGSGIEGEKRRRIGLISKEAPTIKALAEKLMEDRETKNFTDQDYRNAVEEVLQNHISGGSAARELIGIFNATKNELTPEEAKEIDELSTKSLTKVVEDLPEEHQKDLINLLKDYEDQHGYIDWEKLDKDSNGLTSFEPKILSLPEGVQKSLDELIQKNISKGQAEPRNISGEMGGEKTPPKEKSPPEQKVATEAQSELLQPETKEKTPQQSENQLPTEPPQKPPEPILEQGEEGGLPERRFTKQMLRDEELATSPESKAAIEKTLNYTRQHNINSIKEAAEIIDKVGVDEAQNFVINDRDIQPASRVVLGQTLIKKYGELASNAKDKETQDYYWEKQIQTATFVTEKLATEPGQMAQAFSLWSRLSPEAQLRAANQDMAKQGKEKIRRREKDIKTISDKFQKANKETIDELENSKEAKSAIKRAESTREKRAKERIDKAKKKRQDIINKYKKGKGGGLTLTSGGLTKEGIEFVGDIIKTYIDEGVARLDILVDKVLSHIKEVSGKVASDDVKNHVSEIVREQLDKKENQKITAALSDLEKEVTKIVREHYTVPEEAKKKLVDKFIEKVGLEKQDAEQLAKEIETEFDKIATRKKRNILYNEKARFDKINKTLESGKKTEQKTVATDIIKYSNLGAFENKDFQEMMASKYGIGELSTEQAAKLKELADKIQKAPEGTPKRDATEDLLAYRAKLRGNDLMETAQSVWYANVLSGYKTHEKNVVSTFFQSVGELASEMAKDPKAIPYLLGGYLKGVGTRGRLEAAHTILTGRSPIHIKKIETPNVLERKKFIGGNINPANWFKYVMRTMIAEDVLSFQGLKEARAYQLARREAAKMGVNTWSKKGWNEVNKVLLHTKERWQEADAQALQEGLTGREKKRRIYELMEESRPVKMTEDAYGFAAKGTFNHESEGTLGALTNAIAYGLDAVNIGGAKPLRFIVPFTRIITNVVNNSLDYTPIGLVRAARGERGFKTFEKAQVTKSAYKELSKEERQRLVAKAAIGITLTALLQAMHQAGVIQITGGGPDDPKKLAQLKQEGWQPYSIKIGNKYYSYQYTPLVFMTGFLGNMNDAQKYGEKESDKGFWRRVEVASSRIGGQVVDMTWINSASTFMGALANPNPDQQVRGLNNSLAGMAKGFIPLSGAITQTSQAVQNIFNMPQKQVNNAWQAMIADIPIARNSLNDKINALGDPITRDVDVITSKETSDPVWKFLLDKQGWVAPVNRGTLIIFDPEENRDRPVTDDEYYEFSKLRGQKIKESIKEIISKGATIKRDGEKVSKSANELTTGELNILLSNIESNATKESKDELFSPKETKRLKIFINK